VEAGEHPEVLVVMVITAEVVADLLMQVIQVVQVQQDKVIMVVVAVVLLMDHPVAAPEPPALQRVHKLHPLAP
jgi:hypothetical protein